MRHRKAWLSVLYTLSLLSLVSTQGVTLYFSCDFEDDNREWCGMRQGFGDSRFPDGRDYDWMLLSGPTPTYQTDTGSTGPRGAQGNSLVYAYLEGSDPAMPGMEATLETPVIRDADGLTCLTFYYNMHGENVGSLTVYTQVLDRYDDRISYPEYSIEREQGTQWLLFRKTIPMHGRNKRIGWRGMRGPDYKSDIAIDTIRLVEGSCDQPGSVVDLPFVCGFESSASPLCGMIQRNIDNTDWQTYTGSTPSSGTGPDYADDGSWYLYLEASLPATFGDTAIIETPRLTLSGGQRFRDLCISFRYYMYGDTVASLFVYFRSRGEAAPVWQMSGEQGRRWQTANIRAEAIQSDVVGFIGTVGSDLTSDIAIDSLYIEECQDVTTPPNTYVNLPYYCTFENIDFCSLYQSSSDEFNWSIERERTDTLNTGPTRAFEGTYYAYIEASGSNRRPGETAILETPQFNYDGRICIRFEYHMYGDHIGGLTVYTTNRNALDTLLLEEGEDHGNRWILAELEADIAAGDQVVIIGSRGPGVQGDIAIDDIAIQRGFCDGLPTTPPLETGEGMTCDMERDDILESFCRLVQDSDDDFDWVRGTGRTPSGGHFDRRIGNRLYPVTGPSDAYEGSYYYFIEASGMQGNQVARFILDGDNFRAGGPNCLRFSYCMNGFHTGSLAVTSTIRGGGRTTRWELRGDQKQDWHSAAVDLNMDGVQEVGISAETKGKFSGDIAIDSISMTVGGCTDTPSEFIWSCSFETEDGSATMCSMQNGEDDHFDWTLWSGPTDSRYTGPSRAYDGDFYIYIEASKPRREGEGAIVYIPETGYRGAVCVEFAYNMYGYHTGELQVFTRRSNSRDYIQWSQEGEVGARWREQEVYIDSLRSDEEICFRGVVGGEYTGDIALDQIRVRRGGC